MALAGSSASLELSELVRGYPESFPLSSSDPNWNGELRDTWIHEDTDCRAFRRCYSMAGQRPRIMYV